MEYKVIFRNVPYIFDRLFGSYFNLDPIKTSLPVDDSNLSRDKDKFLLSLLENLGIDYEISYIMANAVNPFIGGRYFIALKIRVPLT